MNLPKRNSADGRCYWMKPEVQEELQPLFDQCIQDAIDGRITRLDSLWPPVEWTGRATTKSHYSVVLGYQFMWTSIFGVSSKKTL